MNEKIKVAGLFWPAEEQVADQTTTQSTDQTTTQNTTNDQTTTQSTDQTQATPTVTWKTLGSKTYSVTVSTPSCGITASNPSFTLLKNGSTYSGTTFYTTDTIGARVSYTVKPSGTNCAGYGLVKLEVYVDGSLKGTQQKSYTELTSSRSDSISYTIGKLSAGDHTIELKAYYASNPPA